MINRHLLPHASYCKCCGYDWGEIRTFSYEVCPCCFSEQAVDDLTIRDVRKCRANWVKEGFPWLSLVHDEGTREITIAELKNKLNRDPTEEEITQQLLMDGDIPPEGWNPIQQMLKIDPIFY